MDEVGLLLGTRTNTGMHDEESADTMNVVPISDRQGVTKNPQLAKFHRISTAGTGELFRRTGRKCTTQAELLRDFLHSNGYSFRKVGTIAGVLLVFFLSMTLVVLAVLSDVRAVRKYPSPLVGFQRGKDTRSTMDIIYSCLSTMVISSLSAIHFDIYENKSNKRTNHILLCIVGVLMPEFIVQKASCEYLTTLIGFESIRDRPLGWTLKHSLFAEMGGFKVDGEITRDARKLANIPNVDWEQIGRDISDKSKKDVLAKSIAVIQIGRFLLAMIARAATSLPISPLEYFTCAQVACALLMYIFWFDKPHNVQEPIRISTENLAIKSTPSARKHKGVKFSSIQSASRRLVVLYAATLVGASALGQWNALFSTHTSQVLWRTFSMFSAILPLLSAVAIVFNDVFDNTVTDVLLSFFSALHCLNRLVLIVLVFYSFSNLPTDVYKNVDWLNYIAFIQ